jgi:acetyltransferase-like isoleucine patch superfamily enzyme
MKLIALFFLYLEKLFDRLRMILYSNLFAKCGKNIIFFPTNSKFFYKNISIGNNVSIGYGASFIATRSQITIGNNTMFGSNVTIRGGTHSCHIIGKLMSEYHSQDKLPSDDGTVIIDNDVLIETGAIILKNVHIGRGAIVEAGAVVAANVPPYAIVGGIPAKIIQYLWSTQEILLHEKLVYSDAERLPIEIIEQR